MNYKSLLFWGLIIGLIITLPTLVAFLWFVEPDSKGFAGSEIIGYTTMIVAMSLIFLALRQQRQRLGGLRFGQALGAGTVVNLTASTLFGVGSWLIYGVIAPDFLATYFNHSLDQVRQSGADPIVIQAQLAEMEQSRELMLNPVFGGVLMFTTVFLIGLVTTLISALVLSRRAAASAAA